MSNLVEEYRALSDGVGFVDVSDRSQIELTGDDRVKFLQSFTTNDVAKLSVGQGRETFLLDAKGHVIGHGFVFCTPHSLVLDTAAGHAEKLVKHLDRYLIRERVEIHDRSEVWGELLLAGADADQLLHELTGNQVPKQSLEHVQTQIAWQAVWVRRVAIAGPESFLVAGPSEAIDAVSIGLAAEGANRCGIEAFEAVRIEAGFPLFGRDISDKNLPQEVGRDKQAISFTKGCYLGQETVARIDALGHVNKRLVCLRFLSKALPRVGTALISGDQSVGELTSVANSPQLDSPIALGYVRRGKEEIGARLQSDFGDAEVIEPPRAT